MAYKKTGVHKLTEYEHDCSFNGRWYISGHFIVNEQNEGLYLLQCVSNRMYRRKYVTWEYRKCLLLCIYFDLLNNINTVHRPRWLLFHLK